MFSEASEVCGSEFFDPKFKTVTFTVTFTRLDSTFPPQVLPEPLGRGAAVYLFHNLTSGPPGYKCCVLIAKTRHDGAGVRWSIRARGRATVRGYIASVVLQAVSGHFLGCPGNDFSCRACAPGAVPIGILAAGAWRWTPSVLGNMPANLNPASFGTPVVHVTRER